MTLAADSPKDILAPDGSAALSERAQWRSSLQAVWRAFLLSRLWVIAWVYTGHFLRNKSERVPGGWNGVDVGWLNPWTTFDSYYFLHIAREGYQTLESSAFFPLYPALLRLAGPNESWQAAWGTLLSNVCFLAGLTVLHRLALRMVAPDVARRAVWALAFWPGAVVCSAVYSDAVFLFLATLGFWHVSNRRWLWAALAFFFASLTRNAAPILFLSILVIVVTDGSWRTIRARDAAALLLAPLSFIGIQFFQTARFGPNVLLRAQQHFDRTATAPWTPLLQDFRDILSFDHIVNPATVINVVAAIAQMVFAVLLWQSAKAAPASAGLRRGGAVFMLALTLMALCYGRTFAPYTVSIARYATSAWPFAIALGLYCGAGNDGSARRPTMRALWYGLYIAATALYAWRFGLKEWLF